MNWKSVVWAGCLFPVLAGCGSVRNLTTGSGSAPAQSAFGSGVPGEAGAAWGAVCAQHPRRAFTDEFRDGFLAGYADHQTRGADAQPPAVPPTGYERYKMYLTAGGDALVRDYYLGYQYGIDVAGSGNRRTGSNVPVVPAASRPPVMTAPPKPAADPLPLPPPRPLNKFGDPKKSGSDDPPPLPVPRGPDFPENVGRTEPAPPLPKPEVPVIRPFNPDLSAGGKFSPVPVPPNPDLLPVPNPPLPIPVPGEVPKGTVPPPAVPITPIPVPALKPDAPAAPVYVPAAPFLDPLPVIPFQYTPLPKPQK